MMKRKYSIFAVFILLVVAACGESKYVLQSPAGRLSVKVGQSDKGNLIYRLEKVISMKHFKML